MSWLRNPERRFDSIRHDRGLSALTYVAMDAVRTALRPVLTKIQALKFSG